MMRLIICDEQQLFAEALASLLAERGNDVLGTPRSAERAIELASASAPDAFVVGLRLPGVPGLEAIRSLTAAQGEAPVVALSADSDATLLRRAGEAGAAGICLKLDGIDDLMRVLRSATGLSANGGPTAQGHSKSVTPLLNGRSSPPGSANLTPREDAVLKLLIGGASTTEIAAALGVGAATVRTHLQHLFHRFGVHSRLALVACVVRMQIVQPQSDAPYAGTRS